MANGHEMRWGGVAGLAAIVLAIAAGILLGGAPRVTASPNEIALNLILSRGMIIIAVLLGMAAIAMFVWLGATLATAFRIAEPNSDAPAVVLAGFAITGAIGFLAVSVSGAATFTIATHTMLLVLADGAYTALYVMGTIAAMAVALPLAACAVAVARTTVFPQWAGWLAALAAVVNVLAAITVLSGDGIWAPGSVLTAYVPGALTALSILVFSGLLVREHLPSILTRREQAVGPA